MDKQTWIDLCKRETAALEKYVSALRLYRALFITYDQLLDKQLAYLDACIVQARAYDALLEA